MPLVHAADLLDHARNTGYRVPAFDLTSLDHIVPVIMAAEHAATPVILVFSIESERSLASALAAAVAAARVTSVPVVIEAQMVPDGEAVSRAIRGGANSIKLDSVATIATEQVEKAKMVARVSGVPFFDIREDSAPTHCRDYHRLTVTDIVTHVEIGSELLECSGSGYAEQALTVCRPWREIEHLIVYNVKEDRDARWVEQMMAHGRAVLGAIPGVRRVVTGRALRAEDRYQYCWLVRFTSAAVVASYRDHPNHTAFANTHFRPMAADRISIDYEIVE